MKSRRLPNGKRYQIIELEGVDNASIISTFERLKDQPDTRKTHLFNGRYENIYIARDKIPALEPVFSCLESTLQNITGCEAGKIKLGFWLNAMQPGERTTLHSHDNWDELISAVYYVHVPDKSGYLALIDGAERMALSPRVGRLVMFSPEITHEVTENHADDMRLSVGINVGVEESD